MIIFNEYKYVENMIDTHIVPDGMSVKRVLRYLAKYYYDESFTVKEYKEFIFEQVKEFNFSGIFYQEYKYDSYLKNLCEKLLSGEISHQLRDIESVDIYQSEIDIIKKCENDKQKKLLFTLYVLAKINNTNGWVNYDLKDICSLANVTATITDRSLLIYELYKNGLLDQNNRIDKLGYKVELGSPDEKVVLTISSFKNIGNQYIANFKPGWKMCECCGKLFKIKSKHDGSSKYCKQCAKNIFNEQCKNNMRKLRNSNML